MPHINILDKQTAELIAAGEVVERPSSVVKELVENSIDAGATSIVVEIKNGGISYIRVTDNGCGIAHDEVKIAFLRHATSKIANPDDLDKIGTLGFRGEALASISAVSRVLMLTKTKESLSGTSVSLEGGEVLEVYEAGCPNGTTITIRDLFYNTPARMKFLKKDVTEGNSVAGVLDRLALSHPEISFKFIRDGKQEMFTAGDGDLKSCVYSVFGKDFATSLIEVDEDVEGIHIKGLVSKPEQSRKNRTMQFFFLNSRYVKSVTAMVALEEAYKNSIMVGKFPACVLNIKMTYDLVDVNVHPAKTEVRFANEKPVFEAVYRAVKNALVSKHETPQFEIHKKQSAYNPFAENKPTYTQTTLKNYNTFINNATPKPEIKQDEQRFDTLQQTKPISTDKKEGYYNPVIKDEDNFVNIKQESVLYHKENEPDIVINIPPKANLEEKVEVVVQNHAPVVEEKETAKPTEYQDINIIGEAFSTYIIAQTNDEILFIDKHAAHERILFEKLKATKGALHRQILLAPVIVSLSKEDYDAVIEGKDKMLYYGVGFDDFGNGQIIVREFPSELEKEDVCDIVCELASNLRKGKKDISPEKLDDIYHRMACRAAIKAGDKTSEQEFLAIINILAENNEIRYCPHGRPVAFSLSKTDIEKKFGRKN